MYSTSDALSSKQSSSTYTSNTPLLVLKTPSKGEKCFPSWPRFTVDIYVFIHTEACNGMMYCMIGEHWPELSLAHTPIHVLASTQGHGGRARRECVGRCQNEQIGVVPSFGRSRRTRPIMLSCDRFRCSATDPINLSKHYIAGVSFAISRTKAMTNRDESAWACRTYNFSARLASYKSFIIT